ncbi:DMT family transporter [Hymenobacter sp. BT683]|uniref:DMT family transporter n=1 Tax=Hymenobacter jeongseonensis TaxID=2791027 RepID=A0ABS0IKR7_9BACT|nr:DMT family transporter [Hymenobacter jeongseonensis]MBF9238933.1 DMT family transporter [Hymenobacter jeongseonensis]
MSKLRLDALPPVPSVLLASLSVQAGAAMAKGLFPAVGPSGAAGLRIGLSALMLLAVFRPSLGKLTSTQWRAIIPYGVVLGAMNLFFYLALARIPLGLCVTLEFMGPLLLAVSSSRRVLDFVWVLLAAAGIALIAPWNGNGLDLLGALFALVAGTCWAAYIVLGGRVSQVLPGTAAVATGMIFAALTVLPVTFAGGGLFNLTPTLLASGLALALLSSAIPFTLEMNALRKLPGRTFSVLMSLGPAMAALCGLVFLHEHLSFTQWLAVALVVIASGGATLTAKKPIPAVE